MTEQIMRGLKGVFFDTTEDCFIDEEKGSLLYRGYNIYDLAEKSTFEEGIYLLLCGARPGQPGDQFGNESLCMTGGPQRSREELPGGSHGSLTFQAIIDSCKPR